VRSSLLSLQHARLIDIRNGVGSVVLPRPRAEMDGMEQLLSVETFARREGRKIEIADVRWDEVPAGEEAAERLAIKAGEPVVVVEHVKLLGGDPILIGTDQIPAEVQSRESLEASFDGSVLDALIADDVNAASADTEFTAVGLPRDKARSLKVKTGTPAVFLDQTIRSESGRIVQWAQTWLLPAYFRLTLHRRTPAPR
jgi:GntR family transcriptional regulator